MMASIGGGGGMGVVFVILDIGDGGGGHGAGGGDGNGLILFIDMGEGGGGGVGILETSVNAADDVDGTVLSPPRVDSVASVNGDDGGGGGGIKDVETDLLFENASGGNGGAGYGAGSSLGAFA